MESKSTWKRVGLGAVSLASVALLAACGGDNKSAANKDEINWYTPTEILSLDISKHTDQYSASGIHQVTFFVLTKKVNQNQIWQKVLKCQKMV